MYVHTFITNELCSKWGVLSIFLGQGKEVEVAAVTEMPSSQAGSMTRTAWRSAISSSIILIWTTLSVTHKDILPSQELPPE